MPGLVVEGYVAVKSAGMLSKPTLLLHEEVLVLGSGAIARYNQIVTSRQMSQGNK